MMELQKSHEDSLNKLAAEMKAQDRCWQKQRRDLEQHYSALLSEVQARAQNMQSNLREVNMELSHLRSKYADKESQIGSIQKDLAESQHGREKEKLRVMEAEKEIQNLTRTYQKDTELSHLEYVCKNKSDAMMELQKSHEDSLNKLAAEMKAQDRCWQKQRRDLEQHYSALLSEVQARAQNMQSDLREVNMELSHLRSQYADKESQIGSIQKDLAESQHGWEKEKLRVMEAKKEIQFLTRTYQKDTENMQSDLREVNMELSHLRSQYADKESQIGSIQKDLAESQHGWEKEKLRVMEAKKEIQFLTRTYQKDTENMQSDLREVNMELSHLRSQYADKESQIGSIQKDLAESQHGWEKEKLRVMEAKKEIQFLTRTYQKDTENMQSDLREVNMELSHLRSQYADKESQIGSIQKDLAESQHGWEKEKLRVMEAKKEIQFLTRTYQKDTENMQSDLREVNMELSHLRSQYADKESQIGSIQKDLAESQHGWEKEKLRVMEAKKEIQFLTRTYQKDTEENQTFLHGLYQRLLARGVLIKQPESMLDQFSWSELCLVLQENVDVLISDLNRANEKVSHLEYVCKNKSEAMMELQKRHEDSLNKLAAEMKAQERCWQKQRRDLEQHYSALLSEVQARAQSPDSRLLDTSSQERFSTTVLNNESRLPSQLTSQTSEDEQLMYSSSSEFSELLALCENSESEDELDTFISDMISNISQQSDSQGTKTREEAETGTKVKSPDSRLLDTSSQERFSTTVLNNESRLPSQLTSKTSEDEQLMYSSSSEFSELLALCENSESEDELDTFISDMISNISQQSDSQGTKTRVEAETGTKVKSPDSRLLDTSSQERFSTTVLNNESRLPSQLTSQTSEDEQLMYSSSSEFSELLALCENSESEDELDTFISDMISNISQQSDSQGTKTREEAETGTKVKSPDSRLLDTSSQERFSTTVLNNESRLPSQLTSQTSEDEQLMYSSSSEFSELLALCENSESEDELDTFISDMISNISQQSDSQGTKTREEAETGTKVKSPDSRLLDTSSQERFSTTVLNNESRLPSQLTSQTSEDEQLMYSSSSEFSELLALCENSESEDELDTFISDMISNISQQSDSQGTKTREEAETGTKVKCPDSKSSLLDTSSQERFNSESEDKLDTFISDMISNILQQSAAAVQEQSNVDMSEGDIMEQNILPIEEQEEIPSLNKKRKPWYVRLFCCCWGSRKNRK